ncbi:MAG: hypothetical protein II980_05065, partial [Clostridia bacterium]|nr:hypothetical protein [Clostridia bacterium]
GEYNAIMADKQDEFIISHVFMNVKYGYDVARKELDTGDKIAINDSSVSFVLYGNEGDTTGTGFILNYNAFRVYVVDSNGNEIVVEPFSYVEVTSDVNAKEFTVVSR